MSKREWLYWGATIWLTLELAIGGLIDLARGREVILVGTPVDEVVASLGYPRVPALHPRRVEGPRRRRDHRAGLPAPEGVGVRRELSRSRPRPSLTRSLGPAL